MSAPQTSAQYTPKAAEVIPFPVRSASRDWLSLWHLLSLDAPTVAALWTAFVARVVHVPLRWMTCPAVFVCVWMLYASDRLLDARDLGGPATTSELEERHLYHHRHQRAFVAALFVAAGAAALLVPQLDPAALRLYAALAAFQAVYFFLIHIYFRPTAPLPKELAVGIFFAAAVFIPSAAHVATLKLVPVALAFAAVCTLNCVYVYAWEHAGGQSGAHITTRFAASHPFASAGILFVFTTVLAFVLPHLRPLALALDLSIALLFTLHEVRTRLRRTQLRAAADLALLTPLIVLPFIR
jgi:hypothetical protein